MSERLVECAARMFGSIGWRGCGPVDCNLALFIGTNTWGSRRIQLLLIVTVNWNCKSLIGLKKLVINKQ